MTKFVSEMSFQVNSARMPQTFNMDDSNISTNRRSTEIKCMRAKSKLEILLISCLILSLALSGALVLVILIKYRSPTCSTNNCPKAERIIFSGQTPVSNENTIDQIDLNYQPYSKDPKVNSLIMKSRDHVEILRNILNIPCISVGVSINDTNLWAEGIGYADIENGVKCHKHTRMRLASISKPITSILVGLLLERSKLKLDADINEYLSEKVFPKKKYENQEFNITLRQLMSQMAGIRETKFEDFRTIHNYTDVTQTLSLFANDGLISKPGIEFHYSNPSWNLVGAIIESVLNETFDNAINSLLNQALGMLSSNAENHQMIVPYRAKYYQKNDVTQELENSDITSDILTSVEKWWPAAGIISTVGDLLTFGNNVIKSYRGDYDGILNTSTFNELVRPHSPQPIESDSYYGLGWMVSIANQTNSTFQHKKAFWHNGDFNGVSTLLVILPENQMVITLLANLGGVQNELRKLATNIIEDFVNIL